MPSGPPCAQIPELLSWFNVQLQERLFPEIGRNFGVDPAALRVVDAFLVKYDAAKQRSLSLHCDQSEYSLTISMNPAADYEGGGTYFARRCEAVNCAEARAAVGRNSPPSHLPR